MSGNFIGDAIGNIPIPKSMGSGFKSGASFTLGLWGNQVGNTVNTITESRNK